MTESRAQVDTLVTLFDHILDEETAGFGYDHWHSLVRNLSTVQAGDWDARPAGGERTIRELVRHIGASFPWYASHAFGDGAREWGVQAENGVEIDSTPEEHITWLRACHRVLRDAIVRLTDDQLDAPSGMGEVWTARRVIEVQIQHTLYHTGEINHLRALLQGNDVWGLDDMGREGED
jgi:hypothetical protein